MRTDKVQKYSSKGQESNIRKVAKVYETREQVWKPDKEKKPRQRGNRQDITEEIRTKQVGDNS